MPKNQNKQNKRTKTRDIDVCNGDEITVQSWNNCADILWNCSNQSLQCKIMGHTCIDGKTDLQVGDKCGLWQGDQARIPSHP